MHNISRMVNCRYRSCNSLKVAFVRVGRARGGQTLILRTCSKRSHLALGPNSLNGFSANGLYSMSLKCVHRTMAIYKRIKTIICRRRRRLLSFPSKITTCTASFCKRDVKGWRGGEEGEVPFCRSTFIFIMVLRRLILRKKV